MTRYIPIAHLYLDDDLCPRAQMNEEVIAEYVAVGLQNLPPVVVYCDDSRPSTKSRNISSAKCAHSSI